MSVTINERTKDAIDDWLAVKDGRKSRYFELFGTPEKAARTLAKISCDGCCESCSLYGAGCDDYGDGQLDWLRGDAE